MFEGVRRKRVLITGASGGIGRSLVEVFAAQRARIGVHYKRHHREAAAARQAVVRAGGEAEVFQADLLDHAACRQLVRCFVKRFGGIDVLINNAGAIMGPREFSRLDESSWNRTLALNAKAPFFLSREAFARMKRQGGGKIINISSISVKYGGSSRTMHYGAAKAALEAITVGMARAGAPHGILVNAIRAGFIDTAFHRRMSRRDVAERIRLIPLRRAGRPADVARAALFLASEAGDFITGEILTVGGGD